MGVREGHVATQERERLEGQEKSAQAQQGQTITIAEINGRMQEYQDLNTLLMNRLAVMRGELQLKDATIAELQQSVVALTGKRKPNGR